MSEGHPPRNAGRTEKTAASIALEFVRELIIFFLGIVIGFFWQLYIGEQPASQTHIIVGLVVIIICMARYIYLVKKG